MTTKLSEQVAEFMVMCQQSLPSRPVVPPDDIVRLRLRLVAEEFCELLESCIAPGDAVSLRALEVLERETNHLIASMRVGVNMVELHDALGDVDYVVEGFRLSCGVDGEPIADAIHESNLAKRVGGYTDENGKFRKGPSWKAPDIIGELRAQGFGR